MDQSTFAELEKCGVDTKATLARFGGSAKLYERFLGKFLNDPSFSQTIEALGKGDFAAVLTAAHTLKGVSGNLGLTPVYEISAKMVDSIRAGDNAGAAELQGRLTEAYNSICAVLRT